MVVDDEYTNLIRVLFKTFNQGLCAQLNVLPESKLLSFIGDEWLLEGQVVTGDILDLSQVLSLSTKLPAMTGTASPSPALTLSVWVYCCLAQGGACMMKAASFTQPLDIGRAPAEGGVTVTMAHAF